MLYRRGFCIIRKQLRYFLCLARILAQGTVIELQSTSGRTRKSATTNRRLSYTVPQLMSMKQFPLAAEGRPENFMPKLLKIGENPLSNKGIFLWKSIDKGARV